MGMSPHGAGGEVYIESVTSALIRASGPSAPPLLHCIEESRLWSLRVKKRVVPLRTLIPLQPKQKVTAL